MSAFKKPRKNKTHFDPMRRKRVKGKKIGFTAALEELIKEVRANGSATKTLKNTRRRDIKKDASRVKALNKYADSRRLQRKVEQLLREDTPQAFTKVGASVK